jgi:hypothetical protein
MRRRAEEEAEWDEEGWQEEDSGRESDDDEPTIACPYCRREIHEESPQCPYCGQYVLEEDISAARKPWWIIIGVLLCLLGVWLWIMR